MSVRVFENNKFTHNKETLVKKNRGNMSQWEQVWFSWATARQIQLTCWAIGVCFLVSLTPKFSVVQLGEDVNYTLPICKTQRHIQGISVFRACNKDTLRREGDRKPCHQLYSQASGEGRLRGALKRTLLSAILPGAQLQPLAMSL